MSHPASIPVSVTSSPPAPTAASSGQDPGTGICVGGGGGGGGGNTATGAGATANHPGYTGGQGQLAQLLQQAAAATNGGHGTNSASVASLSSTIAASGLVLLPPPPLTSKNLTIHTSLLSTKQQLMQQQQQLQQLHHAQLNAALKKQQQQHQRQIQLQQQQQQHQYGLKSLSAEECSPSALSDGTMGGGEGLERDGENASMVGCIGNTVTVTGDGGTSQPTSRSTTRVTSPTSAFAPGCPLLTSQGDSGIDHYPPPDQWNYTMTRYHASLIPLCQIEEPPTFYEGMDDHPVETDNDDIAKPHRQMADNSQHDHTPHSQEERAGDERDGTRLGLDEDGDGLVTKSQRRRERTVGSSGDQIFFYDGPNLLHAKLHSNSDREHTKGEGSINKSENGVPTPESHASIINAYDNSNSSSVPQSTKMVCQRSSSRSRSRSRSVTRNSLDSTHSHSRSRSNSGAWSRTLSESLIRKEQVPSSFPPASKTRPSILMRGFSADSGTRQDFDQRSLGATAAAAVTNGRANGNGSIRRMATAKERLVAMVTRGVTGGSTASTGSKDVAANENSSSIKAHRNSMDERSCLRTGPSPILSQTHSRRQGSPSVGRTGYHDYAVGSGISGSPPSDAMLGFPYNNSSLLMSTDISRGGPPAKAAPTLRTSRSNKPRPFSVATMEKLLASNNSRNDAHSHAHREESSPRVHKFRTLHPHDRPDMWPIKSQQLHYRQQQHSVSNDILLREGSDDADTRSKIISSGSHPLLTTFGSPSSAASGNMSLPPPGDDPRKRQESKGKEAADRLNDRLSVSSGIKQLKSMTPEPVMDDLLASNSGGVLVHEHHIHHHYYCQHCPPLIQTNADDMADLEQNYSNAVAPRHLRRRPESTAFFTNTAEYRQRRPLIVDTELSVSPTTENGQSPFGLGSEEPGTAKQPIVQNKKKSILGTMSMTSTMRKRFFAEQKKELMQQQGQGQAQRGNGRQFSPLSSGIARFDKDDEPYDLAGAGIHVKRTQRRFPLEGLSDDDEDGYVPIASNSIQLMQPDRPLSAENGTHDQHQQQQQQRAKFLSRLKRFLLRPSPFAKNSSASTAAGTQGATMASMPATPIDMRAAATVRVTKTRWARSGNNLPDHFVQDDLDADRYPSEGQLIYYPTAAEAI
ncbi:hypothetical protein BGX28_003352 [Mortierella sp. GBA30]|nr:hypothetical protein BGX28_003352 [Mortierella sp. GBA30]